MKISLNWLKEYVDLPADLNAENIAHDLTMTTVEVEGVDHTEELLDKVSVGRVTEIKPHPDADRLQVAITDIGDGTLKEIVCGGSNLQEGMLVAVGAPGAKVRWHGEGELVELKEAKIRGVKSYGMICAANEIGLSDLFPQEGELEIVDLSAYELEVGAPLAEAIGFQDVIFDIDNKSLTNRPDLWGHYGIARELSAIYNTTLKPLPEYSFPDSRDGLSVKIHNTELCGRYTGTVIQGVGGVKTPLWMKVRLALCGQRPINLSVDLTNYVMFAVGQPTHAFDLELLSEGEIHVREAKKNEKIEMLDESKVDLQPGTLVIADSKKPIALAGVMGGKGTGVSEGTTSIVLEAASFNPVHVRKTASSYALRTESSMRFEKGIDAYRVDSGRQLFLSLLQKIQPSITVSAHIDEFPVKPDVVHIKITRDFIIERIGKELSSEEIQSLLNRYGFSISGKEEFAIDVPSWRATGDVSLAEDIVEEVARLSGYESFDFVPPEVKLQKAVRQPAYRIERGVREYLSRVAGMHEIFSYPWVEDQFFNAAGCSDAEALRLADAPSPDATRLQTSLVPQLLKAASLNVRESTEFGLYEIARVFRNGEDRVWSSKEEKLPDQPKMLAGVIVGSDAKSVFLRAKGVLSRLLSSLPVQPLSFLNENEFPVWCAGGASLAIYCGKERAGELSVVSKRTLREADIDRVSLTIFELNLEALQPLEATHYEYQPLSKYPQVDYDLAVLFHENVAWEDVKVRVAGADPLVRNVEFVDEYRGEQIPEGKKSLAFQFTVGHPEKTLTSEEVQAVAEKVLKRLGRDLGGSLREV